MRSALVYSDLEDGFKCLDLSHAGFELIAGHLGSSECLVKHLLFGFSEYYFSTENLTKDIFLRRKMDPEGCIPLSLIATFNRFGFSLDRTSL